MKRLRAVLVRLRVSFARLVRWSLSPVEDKLTVNIIPLPGPAHGPVPAIELRLED